MFCIQDDAEEKKNEEEKLEIHNLMNTMIDLENELKTKDMRIKYLEARIGSKRQKQSPCQSISTQVSIKDMPNLNGKCLWFNGDCHLLKKIIFQCAVEVAFHAKS